MASTDLATQLAPELVPGAAEERKSIHLGMFGRTPPFTRREWRVFGIATTAGFFNQYDGALLSLALKQIQKGLGIAEANLGTMASVIRLGYLCSLLITPFSDVFGRRRLLLYTVIGYTIFTGLSAIAPDERWFVSFQFMARILAGAEGTVAMVIVIEEVGAAYRGWSIGLMGALASCGYGVAALVFATINVMPYGWRGLYAIALIPLGLIIPLRRVLPESHRFEREKLEGVRPSNVLQPLASLFSAYPARLALMLSVIFGLAMGGASAGLYFPKFLQEVHGYSPGNVATLVVIGGAIGILGNIVSGRMSDRFGRRRMGAAFALVATMLAIAMYGAPGRSVIPIWILHLFFGTASDTIIGAYGVELFPTSYRSTAGSALSVAGTTGGAIGLMLEGLMYRASGSHWTDVRYLLLLQLVVPVLIFLLFPETAGRELEDISPEHA
ncbi:MAG TPA: MFS transporter [Candidatus Binataceae bacterium]|nr:MFS transporter [Candidatus Binataceae bacterium]